MSPAVASTVLSKGQGHPTAPHSLAHEGCKAPWSPALLKSQPCLLTSIRYLPTYPGTESHVQTGGTGTTFSHWLSTTLLPAVRFPNKLIPCKLQDELPTDTFSPLALFWVTAVCMWMGCEWMVSSATTPISLPFSVDAHLMPYAAYSGTGTITQSTGAGNGLSQQAKFLEQWPDIHAPEISC